MPQSNQQDSKPSVPAGKDAAHEWPWPDELAADIFNHDKHTKALVSWIQRRYSTKEKSYRIAMLAEMLAEGSTVAAYIWNLYDRPDWPYHATAYATSQTAARRAERDKALDILWRDIDDVRDPKLSLVQVAAKAANAIYWRNLDKVKLEREIKELREGRQ